MILFEILVLEYYCTEFFLVVMPVFIFFIFYLVLILIIIDVSNFRVLKLIGFGGIDLWF